MGHTVLAVPVPALDEVVRERTAFYDPSFVSSDPNFVHAHVTVLAPWIAEPSPFDLDQVGAIAARVRPHPVIFRRVVGFPDDGLIHVAPEPADLFRALTAQLTAAFPGHPPYGGAFGDVSPHLTLDHPAGGVTVAEVRHRLAPHLPTTVTPDRLDLQWWANDDCRLLRSWRLGPGQA